MITIERMQQLAGLKETSPLNPNILILEWNQFRVNQVKKQLIDKINKDRELQRKYWIEKREIDTKLNDEINRNLIILQKIKFLEEKEHETAWNFADELNQQGRYDDANHVVRNYIYGMTQHQNQREPQTTVSQDFKEIWKDSGLPELYNDIRDGLKSGKKEVKSLIKQFTDEAKKEFRVGSNQYKQALGLVKNMIQSTQPQSPAQPTEIPHTNKSAEKPSTVQHDIDPQWNVNPPNSIFNENR